MRRGSGPIGSQSSTQAVTWNLAAPNDRLVSPSSETALNDLGGMTEKWALPLNASSIDTAGNPGTWSLWVSTAVLPGADQFALQAVFGLSRTPNPDETGLLREWSVHTGSRRALC